MKGSGRMLMKKKLLASFCALLLVPTMAVASTNMVSISELYKKALIDAGYKSYVRSADGIYGQWTYDAVRAYQKDVGLSVDGIAGRNTQNKLYGTKY